MLFHVVTSYRPVLTLIFNATCALNTQAAYEICSLCFEATGYRTLDLLFCIYSETL